MPMIVTVALSLTAIVPRSQVTVPLDWVQVPVVVLTDPKTNWAGRGSLTVTAWAGRGHC